MKKCPFCAEEIQESAIKCKHCGSMLDGSGQEQKVSIVGRDPFAELHTDIMGKKKGNITVIGYAGIGLGALMVIMAIVALISSCGYGSKAQGEEVCFLGLIGVGFIIANYLWVRKPLKN